jgi:hypothetical protein
MNHRSCLACLEYGLPGATGCPHREAWLTDKSAEDYLRRQSEKKPKNWDRLSKAAEGKGWFMPSARFKAGHTSSG